MPFSQGVWSGTVGLFIVAIIIFAILRCTGRRQLAFVVGSTNRTPVFGMIAILLGATMSAGLPTRNFARFVLAIWMLACIVLRNSYQGALFQFVQTPMTRAPIGSIDELLAQNYSLRMAPNLLPMFDEIPRLRRM